MTHTKILSSVTRLKNSVNGNPRYDLHFEDGAVHRSASDHSFCYGLESRENFGVPLVVTFTRAGRVSNIEIQEDR